jgi:hypothetical protein
LWGSLGLFPLANVLYVPPWVAASNYVFGILKCFWILAKCFKSIVCQLPSVGRDDYWYIYVYMHIYFNLARLIWFIQQRQIPLLVVNLPWRLQNETKENWTLQRQHWLCQRRWNIKYLSLNQNFLLSERISHDCYCRHLQAPSTHYFIKIKQNIKKKYLAWQHINQWTEY